MTHKRHKIGPPSVASSGNSRWRKRAGLLLTGVVCLVATLWGWRAWREQRFAQKLDAAKTALREARFDDADRLSQTVLHLSPNHPSAIVVAARVAATNRDWKRAFALCDQLPSSERLHAAKLLLADGKAMVESGQARRAEESLRLTRHLDPEDFEATFVLAFVLGAEGRTWEAAPLVRSLIDLNTYDIPQLLVVGATDEFFINQPRFIDQCLRANPNDALPELVQARNALTANDLESAESHLRRVVTKDPWLIEAQARWGRWLLDNQHGTGLPAWHRQLPADADSHPEIWTVRGLWAIRKNQVPAAIRCFAEAARLDPNHRVANLHLGHLLSTAGGRPDLAVQFQKRAELLSELGVPLTTFLRQRDAGLLKRVVTLLEKLGRPREAVAWSELFLREHHDTTWAPQVVQQIRSQFSAEIPWIEPQARLADRIDLSSHPLPEWDDDTESGDQVSQVSDAAPDSEIQFAEIANQVGIRFQYYNDAQSPENPTRMFEFMSGGGLGVLDYDLDGWPDLYATQGSPFSPSANSMIYLDRLFRNSALGQFGDVTATCGIVDPFYGQGVAIGDFDQDGFPDIYVANIGCNQLYRNNGDATFTNITESAGLQDNDWTSSCALADLNGDALPDIFAVNYVGGDDVYTRVCGSGDHPKSCLPTHFEPRQDRVWVNLGDGRFEERTAALSREQTTGRGLGIMTTCSDRPGFLNVFIANDTDPNFWYVNHTSSPGGSLTFEEQGVPSGLAFDADGTPQACMGIAGGDVNRDGLLDLFVTNFYRESNTLYLQQPGGLFIDQTRDAGLRDPSFLQLGFGTQFLDADADGWLELVVTNGHVYNNTHLGEPFKMPPQFFRNIGGGKYAELSSKKLGPWFSGRYLGRALVLWDWNRDGRPDFAVSHADVPLAVLSNETPGPRNRLLLSLRGVKSNREAIGAVVQVTAGTEKWTHWINAGDGYQSSNERRLILGIGQQSVANEVTITWPSGSANR